MVAAHEKSRHMYKCTAKEIAKDHGRLNPSKDNVVVHMSHFISEVNDAKIYKGNFYPKVKATFTHHAPYMSFPLNVVFGNFGLFRPLIKKIMLNIPKISAMLSTGIVFTSMNAGRAEEPQAKAKVAEAKMLLRCVREEDLLVGLEKNKK